MFGKISFTNESIYCAVLTMKFFDCKKTYQITIRANQQIQWSHRIQNEHIKIRHFCALIGIWNWTHLQQQQRVKILEDKLRIWKKQAERNWKQK